MTDYFQSSYFPNSSFPTPSWNMIGSVMSSSKSLGGAMANPLTNYLYPYKELTKLHTKLHLPSLTGRWMDTIPGYTQSGTLYHRIHHGHHLFVDSIKVLRNPDYSFGEFIHHIGCDLFTKHGIPIPFLPTNKLFKVLQQLGLSASTANDILTVNIPKLLGGSLSLICSGTDVWACVADTIPHTWTSATWHGGVGLLDIFFGCFPPNPLILMSGGAEIGVGITTVTRTLIDSFVPTVPDVTLHSSTVSFPLWLEKTSMSSLFNACRGYWNGQSYQQIATGVGINFTSSAISTAISSSLAGNFLAPFIGGAAGFLTGLLLRKIFMSSNQEEYAEAIKQPIQDYFAQSPLFTSSYFTMSNYFDSNSMVLPIMQLPQEPIGQLINNTFTLNPSIFND